MCGTRNALGFFEARLRDAEVQAAAGRDRSNENMKQLLDAVEAQYSMQKEYFLRTHADQNSFDTAMQAVTIHDGELKAELARLIALEQDHREREKDVVNVAGKLLDDERKLRLRVMSENDCLESQLLRATEEVASLKKIFVEGVPCVGGDAERQADLSKDDGCTEHDEAARTSYAKEAGFSPDLAVATCDQHLENYWETKLQMLSAAHKRELDLSNSDSNKALAACEQRLEKDWKVERQTLNANHERELELSSIERNEALAVCEQHSGEDVGCGIYKLDEAQA